MCLIPSNPLCAHFSFYLYLVHIYSLVNCFLFLLDCNDYQSFPVCYILISFRMNWNVSYTYPSLFELCIINMYVMFVNYTQCFCLASYDTSILKQTVLLPLSLFISYSWDLNSYCYTTTCNILKIDFIWIVCQ